MNQLSQFAQAAVYNCSDSPDSTYGAGDFGTCATSTAATPGETPGSDTSVQTGVGAPDTGTFMGLVSSGSFTIIAPLVLALLVATVATVITVRRKKTNR